MMDNFLPKDWRWIKLGDVCSLKNGFAFKSSDYTTSGVSILRISDINDGFVDDSNAIKILPVPEYEKFSVIYGDILIAMSGATTGKFGIYRSENKAYQNQRVGNFIIKYPQILSKVFLFYLLSRLKNKIEQEAYGGAQPNISSKKIEELIIPVPPLPIQRQIVARIEELFSELDAGVQELETALKRLKVYRQAVLHHNLNNPEWERVKLDEITLKVRNGISTKPDKTEGLKILRISAVRPNYINLDDVRFLDYKSEYETYVLNDGDLLFTRYNGSTDYTGVCGVFRNRNNEEITHPDKLIRVILNKDLCNADFVSYSANSGNARSFVRSRIRTTAGQSGVSGSDIKSIPISLPDLQTQNKIVSEIETKLSEADATETTIRQSLKQAEALRQSILKRAFEGRLTTNVTLDDMKDELETEPDEERKPVGNGEQLTLF